MENTFDFYNAQYSDLLTEALRLNKLVATLVEEGQADANKLLYTEKAFENRDRQFKAGRMLIEEMINDSLITDDEYIKQLVEIFGLEIMREVTFNLTITVSGTVELPLGSELDEYGFDIDGLSYNGDNVSIDHESVQIDDWEFTE